MMSSPRGNLDVFEFKEEDELPELAAVKYLDRFKNPNIGNATLKDQCFDRVAEEANVRRKEINSIPCVDLDAINCDRSCDNANSCTPIDTKRENIAHKEEISGLDTLSHSNSIIHKQDSYFKLDKHESRSFLSELEIQDSTVSTVEAPPPGKGQLDFALSQSPSKNEPVDVISDVDDESMDESNPSSPTSEIAEDVSLNGYTLDHCFGDTEMDDMNVELDLYPDYVVYQHICCTGPLLTFTHSCIKFNGSTPHDQGTFNVEWEVDDLVDVKCQWLQRVQTVFIRLRVITKDAVQTNNECGTSGIEELKIAVIEPNWSQKQEAITSLNMKYLAVWDVVVDTDMEMDGVDLLEQRHYFPNFDEPFEEVIYPKGDSDAVSISKRDVDLLQPETFINDTLIDFYIKYLKNQIQPEEKHRFHFFNSFFFRKMADMDKDPNSASDGRAAFLRVRKWTRKVDIFGKDYIFIPINFNLHWSLIVICHPGEVARFKDEDLDKSKVPCILHMDSIKGSHTGLKNLIQSYLWEEWKERQKETSEDISSKFLNLRFVSLELPQQENSFDCGLFLLHYLELFLMEAPVNFSPFKLIKSSKFLNVNWFPSAEASLKRTIIQRLIFELLENRSREVYSSASSEEDQPFEFPENNKNGTGVGFLPERCSPAIACQGNVSSSQVGQGIEITLLSASSMSSQCVNDSNLVLREFLESGATAGSLLGRYPSFDNPSPYYRLNGAISATEEDAEPGDSFVYLPSGETGFQQMVEITPQACAIPYSSGGFGAETSYNLGISVQAEHDAIDSSPTSNCASDDDSEVGIIENCPVGEDVDPSQKEETHEQRSPSTENIECFTESLVSATSKLPDASAVVEDSQDPDNMHDGNGNIDPLPTCQETPVMSVHQDSDMVDNREVACDEVQMIGDGDDHDAESHDEQQAAKRLRLTPPLEL